MMWWHHLFRRRKDEEELEKELHFHLDIHTDDLIAQGYSPDEARRQARLALGGPEQVKESCRDARGTRWLWDLLQDLRYGVRILAKHPGFTAVAVFTLALGIGANTAIFSVVNELLLRPLPYKDADRLVMLWEISPKGNHQNPTSPSNFRSWREQSTTFEGMAAFSDQRLSLTGAGDPEEIPVQLTTP